MKIWYTSFVKILVVGFMLVVGFSVLFFVFIFNEKMQNYETFRVIENSSYVSSAIVYNESLVKINVSGLNFSEIKSLKFVFYGEGEYNLSSSVIRENYDIFASEIGLDDFIGINRIEVEIYYKMVSEINGNILSKKNSGSSNSGGGSQQSGGGQTCVPSRNCDYYYDLGQCGLSLDNGCNTTLNCQNCTIGNCINESCVVLSNCSGECLSMGVFCDSDMIYSCNFSDGCFKKTNMTLCEGGERCLDGECVNEMISVYYIKDGADGDNSGLNWQDAYSSFPLTLQRGAIYYVADGNYSYYNFNSSNGETIYIKKATTIHHGSDVSWQDSYGDGKAIFSGISFSTSNYVFDGQSGGGLGEWNESFGFEIYRENNICNGQLVSLQSNVENITITHAELHSQLDYWMSGIKGTSGIKNLNVSYCYIHDLFGQPFYLGYSENIEISNNYIDKTKSTGADDAFCPYMHSEGIATIGTNVNWTIKNNIWNEISGTAVIAGLNYAVHTGWKIYNNIFANSVTTIWVYADHNHALMSDTEFYNNVIVGESGISQGALRIEDGTNNVAYNNVWYNNIANTFNFFGFEHDYNYYSKNIRVEDCNPPCDMNSQGASGELNAQVENNDLFISWNGDPLISNFELVNPTNSGLNLGSAFNVDFFGNVRTNWDRGIVEYSEVRISLFGQLVRWLGNVVKIFN